MTKPGEGADRDDTTDAMAIVDLLNGGGMAQVVYVAARLGIADALADGPRTTEQVASAVDAHGESIHRLLRALATLGICDELEDGAFALTRLGAHLRSGRPGAVHAFALHWGGSMWPLWGGLFHNVKTGRSPRGLVTRKGAFDSLAAKPEASRAFDDAMVEISSLVAAGVIRCCDFSADQQVADIGGGQGLLLSAILGAWPALRGVLLDQPAVLERARCFLAAAGVADRCTLVPGSFFAAIPAGADAYLMKSVLHDWDDERARAILVNCRTAMNGRGRLVVIERLLPQRVEPIPGHRFIVASDLAMMVAASGRERTDGELRALLQSTGFEVTQVSAASAHYSVIEARCA